jgi:hypothetical protein
VRDSSEGIEREKNNEMLEQVLVREIILYPSSGYLHSYLEITGKL